MHLAVKSAADDAEIAYFVLQDYGLGGAVGTFKTRDFEKAARGGANRAERGIIVPWGADR